jgi:hypothetical protein
MELYSYARGWRRIWVLGELQNKLKVEQDGARRIAPTTCKPLILWWAQQDSNHALTDLK